MLSLNTFIFGAVQVETEYRKRGVYEYVERGTEVSPPKCAKKGSITSPGYSSGQRGLTVNQLTLVFGSSNLSPGTILALIIEAKH